MNSAAIVKRVSAHRLKEAAALADRVFRDGETFMGEAFPEIFSGSLACSYGVYEEDRLVAFLGLVPSILRIGPATVPLFSIGAVCTAPEARGRGYASALLHEAFRHVEDAGGSLLFVSGTLEIYRRSGCHPFGGVRAYRLPCGIKPSATAANSPFEWREAQATDAHRIQALSEQARVRYDRSLFETAALIRASSLAGIYRMESKELLAFIDGEAAAFLIIAVPGEKPAETKPFVVEWGGEAEAVAMLMSAAVAHYSLKDGMEAFVPWQERELMSLLEGVPYREAKHSGTVRVGNPARLWEQLRPYLIGCDADAMNRVEISNVPGESGAADVTVDGETRRLAAEQLISFLFDPDSEPRGLFWRADLLVRLLPIPLPYPSGLNFV